MFVLDSWKVRLRICILRCFLHVHTAKAPFICETFLSICSINFHMFFLYIFWTKASEIIEKSSFDTNPAEKTVLDSKFNQNLSQNGATLGPSWPKEAPRARWEAPKSWKKVDQKYMKKTTNFRDPPGGGGWHERQDLACPWGLGFWTLGSRKMWFSHGRRSDFRASGVFSIFTCPWGIENPPFYQACMECMLGTLVDVSSTGSETPQGREG